MIPHNQLTKNHFLMAMVFFLVGGGAGVIYGSKVTVDEDGGDANYKTLDAVLSAINSGSIDPDTILFIGDDQDTYSWSTDITRTNVGTLVLRSTQNNPDLFPIINRTGTACWSFFQNTNVYFEKLILPNGNTSDSYAWTNAQSYLKTLCFRNCVISAQSSDFFLKMEGGSDNTTIIENCLFTGNAKIFTFDYWGGSPTITIINCTFDNNTTIFDFSANGLPPSTTNISIKNCIFSNNSTTFPSSGDGNTMKSLTSYSLTSESTSGYGTGCVSNSNPQYVSSSRSLPSDWKILSSSPAKDIGTGTTPYTDISGFIRSGALDAGCWEVQSLNHYTWDVSTSSGIQPGSGTWGTNNYWTVSSGNGTTLVAWPGAGTSATFAGSDGSYTITVNGTQNVDSLTFNANGYTLSSGTINFTANSKIVVASGKSALIGSVISGSIGTTKLGAGTLILAGNNTFTGTTTISAGTLQIGNGSTTGSISGNIVNSAELSINRSDTYVYSGIISGTGTLNKAGSGTTILTGNNTYTGTTTISAGTLQLGNGAATGAISSGSNIVNNSALVVNRSDEYFYGGVISGSGTVQKTGTGILTLTGNNTFTGNLTISSGSVRIGVAGTSGSIDANVINNDSIYFDRSDNYTYSKNISGSGKLIKWGPGLLILTGTNTFTGGTLNVDGLGIQIGNGGTTGSLTGNVLNNFPLIFNRSDAYTFSGIISGPGSVSNIGTGTITLSGANSYTGVTTISNGAFSVASLANGGSNSNIGASTSDAANLILNGGTLIYTGPAQSCNRLFTIGTNGATLNASGTGALTLNNTGSIAISGSGSRTLTLTGTNTGINTLAAVISGATTVTKSGTGTWALTATHTYTNPTNITAGTLFINGSIAAGSTCNVNAGATLGGSGTIGGNLSANGTVAPGTGGTGILSIGGNITLSTSTVCELSLNGNTAGTTYDQINVTGTVTLGGASLSPTLGYTPAIGHSYVIINNAGTDAVVGTFSGLSEGATMLLSYGGTSYNTTISYAGGTGNDVVLTVASVATNFFWDTSSTAGIQTGNGTWGINNYWSANGTTLVAWPGAGNTATFAGTDGSYTITVNGTQLVDSVTFLNGTYTLGSGTLNLGSKNGIYVQTGKNAIIGSVINGTAGLKKYGSGMLILTGANTYSGSTSIESGVLQVGNGGTSGNINGNVINNGSLVVNRSNACLISGVISGTGSVTQGGTDTLILTGDNIYSGATLINSGVLQVGGGGTSGIVPGSIINNGAIVFNRSNKYSLSGTISGTGSFTKKGSDTLVLTANHTYTGVTTISSGTLQLGTGGSTAALSSNIINNGSFYFNSSGTYSYDSVISGTGTLTKSGSGTLILTGVNSYTGSTTINAGTLQIGNGGASGSIAGNVVNNSALVVNRSGILSYGGTISGSGTLSKSGTGTLILTGSNTFTGLTSIGSGTLQIGNGGTSGTITGNIANSGSLIVNRSGTFTYGGIISGSGSVTINGTGTVILTGGNTYTGTTTVSSGTLQIGNGGATGSVAGDITANGALVVNRSGTLTYGGVISGTGTLTKTGSGTLVLTGANTFSGGTTIASGVLQIGNGATGSITGNIIDNSTLVFNRTDTLTYDGIISGSGTMTKTGTGTLVLTGTNTFSGATTVSEGTLQIGNGGTTGSVAGNITVNSALVVNRTGTLTYGGAISGSGTLRKSGSGTLILNGTSSFSGGTTIEAGVLQIGSGGTTGSVAGNIANSGLLVFNRSDNHSYGGIISGNGAVEKMGTGTLIISGAHTYTGATTVSGGSLLLTGSLVSGSPVTVRPGGTLGGTGTCNRSIAVNGGAISPGTTGPGKFTTGPLTLDSASVLNFDLGTSSDTLVVNGNLTLDGTINFYAATGFAPKTYRLITYTGSLTNNTLVLGSFPTGSDFSIVFGTGYIDVEVKTGIIQTEPRDTMVTVGSTASFSVTASGTGTITYKWLKYPPANGDSVGNDSSYSIASVSAADNGLVFRCIVKDNTGYDTSRAARLTVISTPVIATQPHDTAVFFGENALFSVSVTDTASVTYVWRRVGSADTLSTAAALTRVSVTFADSGSSYYCLITNLAGSVSSNTVMLHVKHIPPSISQQPVSDTVSIGENALFTVIATGNAAPAFSWRKIGVDTPVGTSASYSITSVSFADTGRYYCIISNPGGTVVSDTVRLLVRHLPPSHADVFPDTLAVFAGSAARFTVTAVGTGPFAYKWYKIGNVSDLLVSVDGDTLLIGSAGFADAGRYYCIVANPGGADTSDTVLLKVDHVAPWGAGIEPDTVAVYEGEPVRFRLTVNGTTPFTYFWHKVRSDVDSLFTVNDDTLYIPAAVSSDSGLYYCIVANPGGADTSDTVHLAVKHHAPVAAFSMTPKSGTVPLQVVFTDASTGIIESWTWRFGDEVISSEKNPTYTYTSPGFYTVTLIVKGPGGTDSLVKRDAIFAYAEGANPVWMTAHYLYGTRVVIYLNAVNQIDTLAPAPICDSLGIWLKPGRLPVNSADGTFLKSYKKSEFNKMTIIDTIALPGADSIYGLMSGLFWNDGTISDFMVANGVLVLLRDTIPPNNFIVPSAEPISPDSIRVFLGNFTSVDIQRIDSLSIWFGADTTSLSMTGPNTRWYAIKNITGGNSSSIIIGDSLFTGARRTLYVAVTLKGKNGLFSTSNISAFTTLGSLPENPLVLRAEALSSTTILLSWNSIDPQKADRARIWFGTTPIRTGIFNQGNLYDSISVPVSATSTVVSGLSEKTTYHFAIQVAKDNIWSMITDVSRTSCTTLEDTTGKPMVNPISIHALFFDSLSSLIRIRWCMDSLLSVQDVEVGITYSLNRYPISAEGNHTIAVLSFCTDTIVRLNEPVRFDTLYYVALWFRRQNGPWINPSLNSRGTVRTGSPFRQVVAFFDSSRTRDTVTAFNGAILLWKDSTYTTKAIIVDTVETFVANRLPEGMTAAGMPFTFIKGYPVLPLYVGIRIDSLPAGVSIYDVRIYSDSAGLYRVHHESAVDSVNGIVYIKTSDLRLPFLALIDTIKPTVTILSDTASYISSTKALKDSLRIIDNIANVRWKYFFGRGDEAPQLRMQGELRTTSLSFSLTISETIHVISSESGLRAFLVITDGVYSDTINLSRSVLRPESDKLTTTAHQWTPIYSTAVLKTTSAMSLVKQVMKHNESDNYDRRHMRLYRWYSYEGNAKNTDKWVEYDQISESIMSLFALEPGRMVWLKTRKNIPLHLDSGYTLSLKKAFSIDLPPGQWTDFGMPYRFGVRMEEILSASGTDADSVQVYRWKRDSASHICFLEPWYVPGIPGSFDRSRTIVYQAGGGYSLFNRSSKTVRLQIPPIPVAMAKKAAKIAIKDDPSWSAVFIAETDNGAMLPSIYFGYSPGVKECAYPIPPSFSPLRLSVFDRRSAQHHGHFISDAANIGLVGELLISNDADSAETIHYSIEKNGAFPEKYSAYCFDAAKKSFDSSGVIPVARKSIASRWIIAGDRVFRENFLKSIMPLQFMLHSPYPNPCRSSVNIRYTVPFGAQERIAITIYNMLGKKIWEKKIDELLTEGHHTVTWNGRDAHGNTTGSGLYIIRLSVIDQNGKVSKRFDCRVTQIR